MPFPVIGAAYVIGLKQVDFWDRGFESPWGINVLCLCLLGVLEAAGSATSWRLLNLLAPELFFLILAYPVYKMWIIQEPNMLELWNKLHFKEEKTENIYHV